jgi:hypothetical protein
MKKAYPPSQASNSKGLSDGQHLQEHYTIPKDLLQ